MSIRLLFLCVIPVMFAGCSSPAPSALMKTALLKANEGKYAESNEFLCDSFKKALSTEESRQDFWDKITRQKTITGIEIKKEDEQRASSTVEFQVIYKDGTNIDTKEFLIKENGYWRLGSMNLTNQDSVRSEKKGFQVGK